MAYRCGPTAIGSQNSWAPISSPTVTDKVFDRPLSGSFDRPLSGNYDRFFNSFERSNAFEYVKSSADKEERHIGHGDIVVNRKSSASFDMADCALAAQTPCSEDEDFYREKILYSQARQLFPLQEDLADWINKTIGITYLTGENFLDVLDNGVELCQLAAVIHDQAKDAIDRGLIVGPVPMISGRCWQRAARRSFFSRDNTQHFITFCKDLGVHENLLFESDDLVLHNQPRQVILCLLEVARLATKFGVEPPGLVQLEKEIALEERDSGLDSAMSGAAWQFLHASPPPTDRSIEPTSSTEPNNTLTVVDNADAESTKSEGTVASTDSDVPLKPTNELDKRVQLVTRLMERGCRCGGQGEGEGGKCSKLLKMKKVGEGRYYIAGRNVFIRLLKGRHMMVRVGGGWDTLEHFLSRHDPCQVRLVTQGKKGDVLPVTLPQPTSSDDELGKLSPISSLQSSKEALRTLSPVDSKASTSSGKSSPVERTRRAGSAGQDVRRTSTPSRPQSARAVRTGLTLPLRVESVDTKLPTPRARKQSAPPSYSTPVTPSRPARTPPAQLKKSLTSTTLTNAPKKSRSMSLALNKPDEKKPFCGTDRLNQARKKSASAASTPTEPTAITRKTRSQSLATSVNEKKPYNGHTNGYSKQARSMSLANPVEFRPISTKSVSVTGAMTQAAIEECIRASLAASVTDQCSNKPFLHIKAKYRSPPPREVPPR